MKKYSILLLLILAAGTAIKANDLSGHTFFNIDPPFQAAMPSKVSLFRTRIHAKQDGIKGAIQLVPFGGKSTNSRELAQFFMPFRKTQLVTGEVSSTAAKNGSVDVMANYFGVLTRPINEVYPAGNPFVGDNLTFQSRIQFKPEHSHVGLGFWYRQIFSEGEPRSWFLDIVTSVMRVKNTVGFKEVIDNPGGGAVPEGYVSSIEDALRGNTVFGDKQFCYGKLPCDPCDTLSKTGLADIELAIGMETRDCDCFVRTFYAGVIIPTGNKPTAEFIFEPIVGNNKHAGIMWGSRMSYEMWTNDRDKYLWIHTNIHSQYLFQNTQKRSFDLTDKQWSRYIWVYPNSKATAITDIEPGINHLTFDVKVSPRSTHNINTALVYCCDWFTAEAGYNLFTRQPELVELECKFVESFGIAGINEGETDNLQTKNNATIRRLFNDQGICDDSTLGEPDTFVTIKEGDLNPNSAAMPCMLASAMYLTLGYRNDDLRAPLLLALGGSYQWSPDNAGLESWQAWGKLALSF